MQRREYELEKRLLQIELLKLQGWVKDTGQKAVLVFEGRDAAAKGGTIKRFTEHLNLRGARVALPGEAVGSGAHAVVLPAVRAASAAWPGRRCSTGPALDQGRRAGDGLLHAR